MNSVQPAMIKIILTTFLFFFSAEMLSAQQIFTADYASRADVTVYVVDYESRADLLVYRVDYASRARGNEGLWYFVEYASRADTQIYFVDYASRADLKIYFVDYQSRAGWRNNSKKHLLY